MTTLVKPNQIWNSMPGWGIVADLTPPELIASRQLRVLRRLIAAGLGALIVLALAGYALVFVQHNSASNALHTEKARTTQLQAQQGKFNDVTRMQGKLDQVQAQLKTVMVGDVDFDKLLTSVRGGLPGTMTINNVSLSLSSGTASSPHQSTTAGGLDTSGQRVIGTVTLSGAALLYKNVAAYVDALTAMDGVINVVPTSQQAAPGSVQYNITLNLTDKLLTHRFDGPKNGGN